MYRKYLKTDEGIIFDYKKMSYVKLWMKNTQIPLDIIFLQNNEIVHIKEKALPCSNYKFNCPTFVKYIFLPFSYAFIAFSSFGISSSILLPLDVYAI